jgi:HD-like signal output (HDOD) protein
MHDVGKLVFAMRSAATRVALTISDQEMTRLVEERHAAMGAYLLGLWGFQNEIVEAVALHHTPSRRATSGLDLTILVHVANRLAHRRDNKVLDPVVLGIEAGSLEGLGLQDRLPQWSAALDEPERQQSGT